MIAEIKNLRDVAFVLIAMFKTIQVSVAERDFQSKPKLVRWIPRTPPRDDIDIAIIAGDSNHRFQTIAQAKRHCRVDGIISFTHVERRAVRLYALNRDRDNYV